jgi:rubrerythrin
MKIDQADTAGLLILTPQRIIDGVLLFSLHNIILQENKMSTPVDDLIMDFSRQLNAAQRYEPFVKRAEESGRPHLAHFFRALIACETVREKQIRGGAIEHADDATDYFVCPGCGLIFIPEAPEKCPVDDTPAAQFERVQ